jgi:hypothetical protein
MPGAVARGVGSVLLLTGAFAIGGILHRTVVEGTLAATSPAAVGGVLVGAALVFAGKRLEGGLAARPPDGGHENGNDGDDDGDGEFDERLSPVDESDLSGRERDDEG